LSELDPSIPYEAIVVAVEHREFKDIDYKKYKDSGAVIYDVKGFVDRSLVDARL